MGTRRKFILGSLAAAGALVVGWSATPPRQRLTTGQPLPVVPGRPAFNGWVRIGTDDSVTVIVPKSEMGQGVHTALAMLLAEELDADWARVAVEASPIDPIYNNMAAAVDGLPFHPDNQGWLKQGAAWMTAKVMREFGVMMTGGSSSVNDLWLPMREAGASARAMLVAAAAARWGVSADTIVVNAGELSHPSGQRARFGELAAAAAQQPLPGALQLKDPAQFKRIGRDTLRLEARAKGAGQASFGLDVLLPGMLYATVKMCPTLGGQVHSLSGDQALALPGVKKVLVVDGHHGGTAGVAVVADTPWHAMKALELVQVRWHEDVPAAQLDSAAAIAMLAAKLAQPAGFAYDKHGDAETALKAAARTVQADYQAPWLAHAAMEPINCTVQFKDGRATVWASTQAPDLARQAVAGVLGLDDASKVDVNVQFLGGGFGRRLEVDFIAQAAAIARAMGDGAPVQTFWSRAEDTQHDFYRPACVARFQAGFDASGQLLGLRNQSVGQAVLPGVMKRIFGLSMAGPDKTTSEGVFDQPYEWPAAHVQHEIVELPVPVGFWRSVGHSHQAFFKESFVDELAAEAKADPLAFRLALLKNHPRHAAVLQLAADKAGWGQPLAAAPDGAPTARGLALHQSFGSIVAQVAEVSVGPDKTIRVHRVVCAVDCGTPVNPNHIRQQMDSGVVFGLSAALYGAIDIVKGRVQQTNFHDYPALRLSACPVIDTHIVASSAHPEGMGEPGTPPIAPAVANALFALTGQRLRALPLKLA